MATHLPDVNVLIALHDSAHSGHEATHKWFANGGSEDWATCPLTENGFARVLSQPQYPNPVGTVSDAGHLLASTIATYGKTHKFWPDSISLLDDQYFDLKTIAGPKQITDAYLLMLCRVHGGMLVTLDSRINKASKIPGTNILIL